MNSEKKAVLDLLYEEPVKIGHWVGFEKLEEIHNQWLRSFLYAEEDQTLLGHRGSYKTTTLSLFLAEHLILKPQENVLFFRKTDPDVSEVIRQTQKILLSSFVQRIVWILYGVNLTLTKATDSEINTNLAFSSRGVSQVLGLGIGTSITGKHADIVVTDDIVNLKDRISRAERERTKIQYQELRNICNRGGRFINTGTPWHKEDAISTMPNVTRYDCYSTGLISRKELEELRKSMSESLFAANYELKHIADQDAMFHDPVFTSKETLLYNGAGHVDASYGGPDGTALTFLKAVPGGYVGLGKLWQKHVDYCLADIAELHRRFRIGTIACEDNADKGYLRKELRTLDIPVAGYHESMNKFVKISTYLRKHWASIQWLEETDPEYIDQILEYSEFAEHDDAPDSAATLLRRITGKITMNSVKGGL